MEQAIVAAVASAAATADVVGLVGARWHRRTPLAYRQARLVAAGAQGLAADFGP
jgi:hypothetical protein